MPCVFPKIQIETSGDESSGFDKLVERQLEDASRRILSDIEDCSFDTAEGREHFLTIVGAGAVGLAEVAAVLPAVKLNVCRMSLWVQISGSRRHDGTR